MSGQLHDVRKCWTDIDRLSDMLKGRSPAESCSAGRRFDGLGSNERGNTSPLPCPRFYKDRDSAGTLKVPNELRPLDARGLRIDWVLRRCAGRNDWGGRRIADDPASDPAVRHSPGG